MRPEVIGAMAGTPASLTVIPFLRNPKMASPDRAELPPSCRTFAYAVFTDVPASTVVKTSPPFEGIERAAAGYCVPAGSPPTPPPPGGGPGGGVELLLFTVTVIVEAV